MVQSVTDRRTDRISKQAVNTALICNVWRCCYWQSAHWLWCSAAIWRIIQGKLSGGGGVSVRGNCARREISGVFVLGSKFSRWELSLGKYVSELPRWVYPILHTLLEVSTCSICDFWPSWLTHRHTERFWPVVL